MLKRLCVGLVLIAVVATIVAPSAAAWTVPPAPQLIDANPYGNQGDWYVGATPPGFDPQKPVIVFVQGLNGSAVNWWGPTVYYGDNDMYEYAYNYGYRTAFVNFRDADGDAGSMWLNGSTLRTQLEQICRYFGVAKVNMVCHSKGGIDTQSAIVHYGAYPFVDRVFTLSTPHWGSETADLAYSWWAGWLASLLGQKSDGTYVLQTGYMQYFRSITDNRSENDTITYYTSAGDDWGPWLSDLWFGGMYLSSYGSNDGLVTVASAHNPRATHVITSNLNHDSIRTGYDSWWYVEPKIRTLSGYTAMSMQAAAIGEQAVESQAPAGNGNYVLRGGEVKKNAVIQLPVEGGTRALVLDLMMAGADVDITLTSPNGVEYKPAAVHADNQFFKGATHYITTVQKPLAGHWKLRIRSERDNAYLLVTCFDSPLQPVLTPGQGKAKGGTPFEVSVGFGGRGPRVKNATARAFLGHVNRGQTKKLAEYVMSQSVNGFTGQLAMPAEPGLYNVHIVIEGTLEDGTPFERTMLRSIVVESDELNGAALLKAIGK